MNPGATVGRSGEAIVVRYPDDAPESRNPIRELDAVLLHGYVQITTQALNLCHRPRRRRALADHLGPVHRPAPRTSAGQVQRRVRQYRALADEATCLRLAKALVRAKVEGQHRYLLRGLAGR